MLTAVLFLSTTCGTLLSHASGFSKISGGGEKEVRGFLPFAAKRQKKLLESNHRESKHS